MCILRPEWYTDEALAKCWGVAVDMVRLYNQSGKLKAEVLFANNEGQDKCWMPEDYTEADWNLLCLEEMHYVGKYYKLQEIEWFEKENPSIKCQTHEKLPYLTPDNQEKYPGGPGEMTLVGWRDICKPFGLNPGRDGKKPKSMKQHTDRDNFPLMRMPNNKPYTYLSQIKKYLALFQKK